MTWSRPLAAPRRDNRLGVREGIRFDSITSLHRLDEELTLGATTLCLPELSPDDFDLHEPQLGERLDDALVVSAVGLQEARHQLVGVVGVGRWPVSRQDATRVAQMFHQVGGGGGVWYCHDRLAFVYKDAKRW